MVFKRLFLLILIPALISCGKWNLSGLDFTSRPKGTVCPLVLVPQEELTPKLSLDGRPAPSLHIDEMAFNFGNSVEEDEFSHSFKVRNLGTAPLEIRKIVPG